MVSPGVSSGTYDFSPSLADVVLEAFERIQVQPTAPEHFTTARRSLNLLMVEWANKGVNLWSVTLHSIALVQGTATYDLPQETVMMLDTYYTITSGSPPVDTDRIMVGISRTDYAAIAQKGQQGAPTTFYFDRLTPTPTVTLWLVPDGNGPYTLNTYIMTRVQDANPSMGETADVPYRFYDALCAGLCAKLAEKLKPDLFVAKKALATEAWIVASTEDRERTPVTMAQDWGVYRVL